jgi:hypothetical protein
MKAVGVGSAHVELTEREAIKRAPPGIASARLWYSCERQRHHAIRQVQVPRVLWSEWDSGSFSFGMERVTDWVHPLQQLGTDWLWNAAGSVAEACTSTLVDGHRVREAVLRKLAALQSGCTGHTLGTHEVAFRAALAACADAVAGAMPAVPFGQPHGDFTTCNLLLRSDGGLIAIDFLDSDVPSPVVDVAKLRQDTRWGWAEANGAALPDAAHAADRWWVDRWCGEPWWPWVAPLTALALLRAVPYVRETAMRGWLVGQAAEASMEAVCRIH